MLFDMYYKYELMLFFLKYHGKKLTGSLNVEMVLNNSVKLCLKLLLKRSCFLIGNGIQMLK